MTDGLPPEPSGAPASPPVRERGAHRGQARRPTLAIALIAVGVVALAAIGVVGWIKGVGKSSTPTAHSSISGHTPSAQASGPSHSPSPTSAGSSSPVSSTTPSASATASPTTAPSTQSTGAASPTSPANTPKAPVVPASARPSVVVLNQTGVTGLAARVADRLTAAHWTVSGIGNWQGNVPSTTVYYPPGAEQSAQALASTLGQNRIRPRVSGMPLDRLTLILAGTDPP